MTIDPSSNNRIYRLITGLKKDERTVKSSNYESNQSGINTKGFEEIVDDIIQLRNSGVGGGKQINGRIIQARRSRSFRYR